MARLTGRVTINVDGVTLRSKSGSKLTNFGGVSRKAVPGANGINGYVEETVVPTIECTISHGGDTSLTAFAKMTDVTVNFICDSGKIYTMPHAYLADAPGVADGEGDVTLKFEAATCEEIS